MGYLLKPFDDRELRTVIELALQRAQAERKLRQSERRYASTLRGIADGVIATDAVCTVQFMNASAEILTGWTWLEALGQPLNRVFRVIEAQSRVPLERLRSQLLANRPVAVPADELLLLRRDNREARIEYSIAPVPGDHGETSGVVVILRDITERIRAEQTQRESELRHVTEQRVLTERSRIARDLHDDLGNRLSEIQILGERIAAPQTAETERFGLCHRVGRRAVAAVQALDELVWLLSPKYDTWSALVQRMEHDALGYLASTGITHRFRTAVATECPIEPILRRTMLMALRELLHNAVEHAQAKCISVCASSNRDRVGLAVIDDGRGFHSEIALAQQRGLAGLNARALELGGALQIQSRPERTIVRMRFRKSSPNASVHLGMNPISPAH